MFQPYLAASVANLGTVLSEMGQGEAAEAATREAVDLYRPLATRDPDAFQTYLAMSLANLGSMLNELGQGEAAEAATREAVDLQRMLVTHTKPL